MTFSLAFVLVAVTVSAGQVPTETVTGPISSTAVWDWEPGVRSMPELPMPDLVSSIDTWLGVAYYWVKTTFIDTNSVDYYIIYNFAVGMLGNAIGNILGRARGKIDEYR